MNKRKQKKQVVTTQRQESTPADDHEESTDSSMRGEASSRRSGTDVTDHVGGLVRLGDRVKDGGDVGSNTGDELGVEMSLGLGEDAGADMSDRLESDKAGDNVKVVSVISGDGTSQTGSGSDGFGGSVDGSAGSCRGVSLGVVDDRVEAGVNVLATANPLP